MNAAELDEEARELIEAGRDGVSPSPLVRARVQRSVQAKLAAGVSVAALAVAPSALGASVKAGALLAIAAAVATGGWYYSTTGSGDANGAAATPPKTVVPTPAVPRAARPHEAPRAKDDRKEPEKPAAAAPDEPVRAAPAKGVESRKASAEAGLADEVALLSKASAALNRGQTARAQELLTQYDQLGSKRLVEERSASGVLLLCRSGRVGEAQAAAKRFFKRFPKSPLASRVRASCAGDSLRK